MFLKSTILFFLYMILWLSLSGHYEPLIIGFGVLSCLLCVYITRKSGFLDIEGFPSHLFYGLPSYFIWLSYEILKANYDTAKVIFSSNINPQVFNVKSSQKTVAGQVTYANSITLTPGTVTIQIDDDNFEIHALTKEMAEDVKSGEMDKRVSVLEGMKNV